MEHLGIGISMGPIYCENTGENYGPNHPGFYSQVANLKMAIYIH